MQFYAPYLILNIVLAVEQSNDERFKAALNITHAILFTNSGACEPSVLLLEDKTHSRNAITEILPSRFQE